MNGANRMPKPGEDPAAAALRDAPPAALDPTLTTLDTIAKGAAKELFQVELDRVLENILDPNTDPEKKRSVTLEVSFSPSETRTEVTVEVKAKSKICAPHGVGCTLFVGRKMGRAVATGFDPSQMQIEWDREAQPKALPPKK